MRILHLSDIHFREPDCNGGFDPNQQVRDELANYLETAVQEQGPVNAIFVTGDIAFKGHADEFRAAATWLNRLAEIGGCREDDIEVVPGNHDVDRSVYSQISVKTTVQAISDKNNVAGCEQQFLATLRDEEASEHLFRPIKEYNSFAAKYDCAIYPKRPCWDKDFALTDGVVLRVKGLTTSYLSQIGENDDEGSLFIGAPQFNLRPGAGILNMSLGHHPPEWCMDRDDIIDSVLNRPVISLWGHKHRQRSIRNDNGALFLSAGATNPERDGTAVACPTEVIQAICQTQRVAHSGDHAAFTL